MTKEIATKFKILSWDEKPYREHSDGSKFTRAEVTLRDEQGPADGTFEALMYYRPDGTTSYVTLMRIEGTLDGRTGGFVLRGEGTFDGTTATGESVVVDGSGTGELAGITGTARSVSTHDDYPYMPLTFRYDLP
jgi:hypothetical protein